MALILTRDKTQCHIYEICMRNATINEAYDNVRYFLNLANLNYRDVSVSKIIVDSYCPLTFLLQFELTEEEALLFALTANPISIIKIE